MNPQLAIFVTFCILSTSGKIYDRCELAKELLEVHEAPKHQIAVWVCIAEHESQFNTSAIGMMNGDTSKDHGIFQISDLYWCSPPGRGWACGVTCAELEDDNIEDDFICARRIYREHKKLSGDGFNAWAVYRPFCSDPSVEQYISGCFNATKKEESDIKKVASTPDLSSTIKEGSTTTAQSASTKSEISSTIAPSSSTTVTTTESKFLSALKPKSNQVLEDHFRAVPEKPWFHWFTRFRWN